MPAVSFYSTLCMYFTVCGRENSLRFSPARPFQDYTYRESFRSMTLWMLCTRLMSAPSMRPRAAWVCSSSLLVVIFTSQLGVGFDELL